VEKPEQVRRALVLLWASFGISAIEVIVAEVLEISDPTMWIFLIFMYAVWAYVIVAISRQRNWARIVSLVVAVLTTALWVAWPEARPEQWSETITTVASVVLEAVALYLLFSGAGGAWFGARTA
jgi:hypothetical protein